MRTSKAQVRSVGLWVVVMAWVAVTIFASPAQATTIELYSWFSEATPDGQRELEIIEAFKAAHPGIEVTYTSTPFGPEYFEKLLVRIVSGDPPDVAAVNMDQFTFLRQRTPFSSGYGARRRRHRSVLSPGAGRLHLQGEAAWASL